MVCLISAIGLSLHMFAKHHSALRDKVICKSQLRTARSKIGLQILCDL